MINNLEGMSAKELRELVSVQMGEHQKLVAELEAVKRERNELLGLIYNYAIGEVAMGVTPDMEQMGRDAHEITGINAEQLRQQASEVE